MVLVILCPMVIMSRQLQQCWSLKGMAMKGWGLQDEGLGFSIVKTPETNRINCRGGRCWILITALEPTAATVIVVCPTSPPIARHFFFFLIFRNCNQPPCWRVSDRTKWIWHGTTHGPEHCKGWTVDMTHVLQHSPPQKDSWLTSVTLPEGFPFLFFSGCGNMFEHRASLEY